MTAGSFSRALVACILRTRIIPDVVRTDRGPEMTSAVVTEFLAICNAPQSLGGSYTPRHQGPVERSHQETAIDVLVLLHQVCRAFPQEWASLVGAVEYLCDTAPRGPEGLSAFELTQGHALASPADRRLVPFIMPQGVAVADVAARILQNFRELFLNFSKFIQSFSLFFFN